MIKNKNGIELKTERLILRPVQIGDEAAIHEYAGDKDITMMFYLPNDTFEETCDFVRKNAAEWQSPEQTDFEFVILYNGRIIGGCDADLSHSEDRSYSTLGWIINKEYRGRGFASEAAEALLDFAFENLDIEKVYAQCDINNPASFGVMKKIGMTCINDKGTRTYPKTGRTSGEYTCLITEDEWKAKKRKDIKMEIWDAYDSEFNIIDGMTLIRGEEKSIPDGVYHLVCHVLVKHVDGTFLLMKRDPRKSYPNMWEATASGSALKGESPLECAVRELQEETGVVVSGLEEIRRFVWDPTHCIHIEYLCVTDCDKDSIVLQDGETADFKWAEADEISRMKSDEILSEGMRRYVSTHSGQMKLVFPCPEYKDKAIDYINEFHEYGSEIHGSGSLDSFLEESTYEEWLEKIISYMDIANIPDSKVPGLTYFYVREEDDRIVGMVNIRLALNDYLRKEGGHIGYSVRPTERRRNYATDMLTMALKVCGRIGIKEVLVSCDKKNKASAGVIKKCDGLLKDEFFSETYGETIQMYGIQV